MELHVDAVHPGERAIVIDDLVATGGTLSAAIRLLGDLRAFFLLPLQFTYNCSIYVVPSKWFILTSYFVERSGAEVVECACVIGVPEVKVMAKLL